MKYQFNLIARCSVIAAAVTALSLSGSVFGADAKNKETPAALDSKDKDFMMDAAKGGTMEVEMGKMAEQKGTSAEVKKVGKTMVTDHSKANDQLMALAKKKGVALDTSRKMEKMDDSKFDHEYLEQIVKDHDKDIAAFEKEAKDGKDADVKAWAGKTLPTLKKHLQMVKDAQGKVDKKS